MLPDASHWLASHSAASLSPELWWSCRSTSEARQLASPWFEAATSRPLGYLNSGSGYLRLRSALRCDGSQRVQRLTATELCYLGL